MPKLFVINIKFINHTNICEFSNWNKVKRYHLLSCPARAEWVQILSRPDTMDTMADWRDRNTGKLIICPISPCPVTRQQMSTVFFATKCLGVLLQRYYLDKTIKCQEGEEKMYYTLSLAFEAPRSEWGTWENISHKIYWIRMNNLSLRVFNWMLFWNDKKSLEKELCLCEIWDVQPWNQRRHSAHSSRLPRSGC